MINLNESHLNPSIPSVPSDRNLLHTNPSQNNFRNFQNSSEGFSFKKGHTTTRATLAPHSPQIGIANIGIIEEQAGLSANNSQPDISIGVDNMEVLKNMNSARSIQKNSTSPPTAVKMGFQPKVSYGTLDNHSSSTPFSTVSQPNKFSDNYSFRNKEIQPFRISPAYLESNSFEGDKEFHKRTLSKIKELEDKVSQAIRRNSNTSQIEENNLNVSPINKSPKAS